MQDPHRRVVVAVDMDEQVKEAVRPYWEQLIRLDCEHDVRVRRAEYTERLSRQWTDILTDLLGSPAAAGAAEMPEKELAEVVGRIVAEQRAAAEKLEDMMAEKANSTDMQERCEHFEQLRERLERRADGSIQPRPPQPAMETARSEPGWKIDPTAGRPVDGKESARRSDRGAARPRVV